MNLLRHSYLLFFFCLLIACNKQDDPQPSNLTFNHDSENLSSPNLSAGTWEAGASFSSIQTENVSGKELSKVEVYIYNKPDSAWISVYSSGTTSPGTLLYTKEVTNDLSAFGWNTHTLTDEVEITDGLWITFGYTITTTKQVIGCDAGPAVTGGDRLKSGTSNWSTFTSLFSQDVNWNIRGTAKLQK